MTLVRELRCQAARLLQRLMTDRELSERRHAEAGRRDPMKSITGRTSFDAAIASAKEMIHQLDEAMEGALPRAVEPRRAHARNGANGSPAASRGQRRAVPLAAAS